MAASTQQKLDYLLKKIGYTASKTGLAEDSSLSGTKKAPFAEAIPSPLQIASNSLWADSNYIPSTPPGSDTDYVKVYLSGTSGHRMTVDSTVSGNRAFIPYSTYNDNSSGILGDWIDTQYGDGYIVKVYKGDPNSGGVQLSAAGSGSNDTWFFDYSSGILNFNGTVVPSGVTGTNIYIVGYRYIGAKGATPPGGIGTFSSLVISGVSTFNNTVNLPDNKKIQLGDSGDLQLYHAVSGGGSTSYVDNNTGPLYIRNNVDDDDGGNIIIEAKAGKASAVFQDDEGVRLYYDNAEKIRTTNEGVLVSGGTTTGTLSVTGLSTLDDVNVSGGSTFGGNVTFNNLVQATGNVDLGGDDADTISVNGRFDTNLVPSADVTQDLGQATGPTRRWRTLHTNYVNAVGVGTFGSLDISGDIDVDGHTELDDVNVGGAITATTFTGNLAGTVNTAAQPNITSLGTLTGLDVNGHSELDDVNVSGAITATTFTGNLAGTVNTAAQPNITSLGTLTGLDVNGHSELDNVNVSGVSTFTGAIDANGGADISGGSGLNVTGHTELDDVNVSGVATIASAKISDLTSSRVTYAGAGGELQDSSNLTFDGTDITAASAKVSDLTNNRLVIAGASGALEDSSKVTFDGTTFTIDGDASFTGNVTIGGTLTKDDVTNIDSVGVVTAGQGLRATAGGLVVTSGVSTFSDSAYFPDNSKINFGDAASPDLEIYHSGAHSFIKDNGTGDLKIQGGADVVIESTAGANSAVFNTDGSVELYYRGTGAGKKLETTGHGAIVTGVLTATTFSGSGASLNSIPNGALDNSTVSYGGISLALGGTDATPAFDLTDATNYPYTSLTGIVTHIVGDTTPELGGNLNGNSKDIYGVGIITATTLDISGNIDVDGHTELDDVNVGGAITATTFTGNLAGTVNTAAQPNITSLGTLSSVTVSGNINANGNIVGDSATNISGINSVTATTFYGDGQYLTGIAGTTGTTIFENITVSGNAGIGSLNITGVSTFAGHVGFTTGINVTGISTFTGIYIQDDSGNNDVIIDNNLLTNHVFISLKDDCKAQFGNGTDLQIWHDGDDSYILDQGAGDLIIGANDTVKITNGAGTENKIVATTDGSVDLYYDNAKKFETTSTGSIVTGVLTATTFSGNLTGTVNTAAQPNITSLGTLTSLDVSGNITGAGDLTLTDTDAGSAAGPELKLFRNSATPDDADYIGQIKFAGESDTGVERNYAKITGKILDASNTNEDGILEFAHIKAGSQTITGRFRSDSLQLLNGTALSVAGDITANGNIAGDDSTNISGINSVTATSFFGVGSGLTGIANASVASDAAIAGTKISPNFGSQNIVTTGDFNSGSVTITGGTPAITFTDNNNDPDYYIQNNNGALRIYDATNGAERFVVNADGSIALGTGSTIGAVTGVTTYYGDGQYLTNVGGASTDAWAADSQENLVAGNGAGAARDADTCFNVMIGCNAGKALNSGDYNVFTGFSAGKDATGAGCNIAIGYSAGSGLTQGTNQVFIGTRTGEHASNTNSRNGVAIGYYAGNNAVCYDVYIGCGAGKLNDGKYNIAIGSGVGAGITDGNCNIMMGHLAGNLVTTGDTNVFLGRRAGQCATCSENNVFIGGYAGHNTQNTASGDTNVAIGYAAGMCLGATARCNTIIGPYAGKELDAGCDNILLGQGPGYNIAGGSYNTFLGHYTGETTTTGSNNIAIGKRVQLPSATGSDQFAIGCCSSHWITGNANFNVGIGTTNPDIAVGVGNTAKLSVGILSAYQLYGDGSKLTGIVTSTGINTEGSSTFEDITVNGNAGIGSLNVTGVSTFAGLMDANGGATIDNVRIGVAGNNEIDTSSGNLTIDSAAGTVVVDDNLNVNDALTVTNTLNAHGNITGDGATNITGIDGVTASTLTGTLQTAAQPNITSVGSLSSLTVTGNVSIGGTLTYEDVTNVDSLGIITARSGIEVSGIVTARAGLAVTYYGDGQFLTGITTAGMQGKWTQDSYANLKAGTDAGENFGSNTLGNIAIGSSSARRLDTGDYNVSIGTSAGVNMTSGFANVVIGNRAAYHSSGTSHFNIYIGNDAAKCKQGGGSNIAMGLYALYGSSTPSNNTSSGNIALGECAGKDNTSGSYNVLFGRSAGENITTGTCNVIMGSWAASSGTITGQRNIIFGQEAAKLATSANYNVIAGYRAAGNGTLTGGYNQIFGPNAGCSLTSGYNNFIGGYNAGRVTTGGANNIVIGPGAASVGALANQNIILGNCAGRCVSGGYNVMFGNHTGCQITSGQHNTFVGGYAGKNNTGGICYSIAIGHKVDLPIIDGTAANTQLAIGCNGTNWIVGNANFNVGIGTTNPDIAVGVGNTAKLSVGIVSAYQLYGDGSNLSGVGFSPDSDENLVAGTDAGACLASPGCFNVMLGYHAGRCVFSAPAGIFIGKNTGCKATNAQYPIYIGRCAGMNNTAGTGNIAIGACAAGYGCNGGDYNLILGTNSGRSLTSGSTNIILGTTGAGENLCSGSSNILIGGNSGKNLTTGTFNIFFGTAVCASAVSSSCELGIGVCNKRWICGDSNFNVGIGTNPADAVGSATTSRLSVGIVSAYQLYGDGSNLSNVGFSPDDEGNLVAGTLAGTNKDADTLQNIFLGCKAGCCVNAGDQNVFIGCKSGQYTTSGSHNIGIGAETLGLNTPGNYNIAFGYFAGRAPSSTTNNVWIGKCVAAENAVTGIENIAIGCHAMCKASSGSNNIAFGRSAMGAANVTGSYNVAFGYQAGCALTSGITHVLIGKYAGKGLGGSENNIFMGLYSGCATSGGNHNVAIGANTMIGTGNKTGNTSLGRFAGCAITAAQYNTFLGYGAGHHTTTGCYNIAIGCAVCLSANSASNELAIGCGTKRWICGDSNFNVGIGTNPADVVGSATTSKLSVGIVSAYMLYGCGANITGIDAGWEQDSNCNLIAGKDAGTCAGDSPSTFNIIIGCGTGCFNGNGEHNVVMGTHSGRCAVGATRNVLIGMCAGTCVNNGKCNVYIGNYSGANQYCSDNIAIGCKALCGSGTASNNTGANNIALGKESGSLVTSGTNNVFLGESSGANITTSNSSVFIGEATGKCMQTGAHNLAMGSAALMGSTTPADNTGSCNIGIGKGAGSCMTTASTNVLIGCKAGNQITTGAHNVVMGSLALGTGTVTGSYNIAMGFCAGAEITSGEENVFLGKCAGCNATTGCYNIAFSKLALGTGVVTGNNNIALGCQASQGLTSGYSNVVIGHNGSAAGTITGYFNVSLGRNALNCLSSGHDNFVGGYNAGRCLTTGDYNVFLGSCAGAGNGAAVTGNRNIALGCGALNNVVAVDDTIAIGRLSGKTAGGGNGNIFLGAYSGSQNGTAADNDAANNIAIGYATGCGLTDGDNNIFMGNSAGGHTTTGLANVMIGNYAGQCHVSGSENVYISHCAGRCMCNGSTNIAIGQHALQGSSTVSDNTGSCNIAIGMAAGCILNSGKNNILLGLVAGDSITTGSCNVVIGCGADVSSATGDKQLAIGVGGSCWISGDSSFNVTVNTICASNFNSTSDIRLKTNILPIGNPIGKVKQIEGVSFNWKKDDKPALGVIADQVEKILPELVHGDDPKTVNYNGLIGLLIEAVKEQQTQIETLKDRISKLE